MNSTPKRKKLLFLYSELAEYFLACLRELAKQGYEIRVVHFPVNKEAPFKLNFPENILFYSNENYSFSALSELIADFSPDFVYCSGWICKPYLRICKSYNRKIPVVLALDNPWKGTVRQHVAVLLNTFVKSIFTHAWVAGERQKSYALKLGFSEKQILTGVYAADVNYFSAIHQSVRSDKEQNFPKRFLFVGRYEKVKGLDDLLFVFNANQKEMNGWELWCAGTGELSKLFTENKSVRNLGFVQPAEMKKIIAQTGVFVLPSRYEPWGVAVQELAASGFPLICSDEVGAAEIFLKDNINGFMFESDNRASLAEAMLKIVKMSDKELLKMGEMSANQSLQITPAIWAEKINSLL